MVLPDVNLLIHAHNTDTAVHDCARRWWDACLSGSELAWATLLGFIRITTNRRIMLRPLPVADVMTRIANWFELPHIHIPQPSPSHFVGLRSVLERLGTAANPTTDADFARFPGLRWVNPCAA
jgi:toxin-antitoxin system PIN domain toxin